MLRPLDDPFLPDGGMRLVSGNLGRATFKTSAVEPTSAGRSRRPCRVFADQDDVLAAFQAGELDRDVVVVVRFQGPRANGMPELHKLTPALGVLQDRGYKVALVTDGRMSGASGKVPAAIHVSPEALGGGPLALAARRRRGAAVRRRDGMLEAVGVDLPAREPRQPPPPPLGTGRELFALMRRERRRAEHGASAMLAAMDAGIIRAAVRSVERAPARFLEEQEVDERRCGEARPNTTARRRIAGQRDDREAGHRQEAADPASADMVGQGHAV